MSQLDNLVESFESKIKELQDILSKIKTEQKVGQQQTECQAQTWVEYLTKLRDDSNMELKKKIDDLHEEIGGIQYDLKNVTEILESTQKQLSELEKPLVQKIEYAKSKQKMIDELSKLDYTTIASFSLTYYYDDIRMEAGVVPTRQLNFGINGITAHYLSTDYLRSSSNVCNLLQPSERINDFLKKAKQFEKE